MLLRLLLSTSTLFLSLIFGAFALAIVAVYSPALLHELLVLAGDLKSIITSTGLDPQYNIWVELLLEERQLLFMFFTIGVRIIIGLLAGFAGLALGRR